MIDVVVSCAAFLGGWLLFAGPIYQASVELRTQERVRDGIALAVRAAAVPRRVSSWWWLFPPVAVLLQWQQTRRFQREVFGLLSREQVTEWLRLTDKATGWWLVAAGAFLIALHETHQLLEAFDVQGWVLWPVAIGATTLAVAFTIVRQHRTARLEALLVERPE